MTVLRNEANGESLAFDNRDYVLHRFDAGYAEVEIEEYRGFEQVGTYMPASSVGKRAVSFDAYILADSAADMAAKKQKLARILDPKGSFFIERDGVLMECRLTRTVAYSSEPYFTGYGAAFFSVKAVCAKPYFTKSGKTENGFYTYTGNLIYPLGIDGETGFVFGVRNSITVLRVTNEGDLSCGCVIELVSDSALEGLYLENAASHEYFRLNKAIAVGEKIIIDTRSGKKSALSVKNGVTENIMRYVDYRSSFFSLPVGESVFSVDTGRADADISLTFTYEQIYLYV